MKTIARMSLGIVSLLAAVGLGYSPFTAAASCSCAFRSIEERADSAELVVLASVAEMEPDGDAVLQVERYYKGAGPERIIVDNPETSSGGALCDFAVSGPNRFVLFLTAGSEGFQVNACSGSLGLYGFKEEAAYVASIQAFFDAGPAALPDGGGPPLQESEADNKDLPWYVFLAGAFVVPVGVLFVGSFVIRRGPGGH